MKWKGFIKKLEEIYENVNQIDDSTVYFENNLVRMVRKNKNKLDLYFHADINPAFSAEIGLVIASMQYDYNFSLDDIEVFYYSGDSIYRGRKALEESEIKKIDNIKLNFEQEHLLENMTDEEMFWC